MNFSIYRSMKLHEEKPICYQIDSIGDHIVKTQMDLNLEALLERY